MPDNEEVEQTKHQHHANLAAEHKRLAEFHEKHSAGASANEVGANKSAGGQMGDFFGAVMDHKWIIIGGLAVVVVVFVAVQNFNNNNANTSNTTGTSNQAPDYTQGGFVPSNISTQLDSINAAIEALQNQPTPSTPTTPTPPTHQPKIFCIFGYVPDGNGGCRPATQGPGSFPAPGSQPPTQNPLNPMQSIPALNSSPVPSPQPSRQYVTVGNWSSSNPPWNSYLSGIAQHSGISLSRIESLNPQITNPNLIYPGQKVRVS